MLHFAVECRSQRHQELELCAASKAAHLLEIGIYIYIPMKC